MKALFFPHPRDLTIGYDAVIQRCIAPTGVVQNGRPEFVDLVGRPSDQLLAYLLLDSVFPSPTPIFTLDVEMKIRDRAGKFKWGLKIIDVLPPPRSRLFENDISIHGAVWNNEEPEPSLGIRAFFRFQKDGSLTFSEVFLLGKEPKPVN